MSARKVSPNSHQKLLYDTHWSHHGETTIKMDSSDTSNSVRTSHTERHPSAVKSAGLSLIANVFGCYGMRNGPPPSYNYAIVTCIMVVSVMGVAACIVMLISQISNGGVNIEFMCMWTVIGFFSIKAPIMYLHAGLLFRRLTVFLEQLAQTVNTIKTEGHCRQSVKDNVASRIGRMTTLALSISAVVTLAGAISSVICFPVAPEHVPEHYRLYVYGYSITVDLMKVFLLIWFLVANSFTYLCTSMLIIICKVMNICFDCLLPENRRDTFDINFLLNDKASIEDRSATRHSNDHKGAPLLELTIGQRQQWHERLCMLVSEANHLFAPFMLLSLAGEITVLMLYSQSGNVRDWLHGLVLSVVQSIMFLLTTVYCASVNEKVVSSLMLAPQHSLEEIRSYSGEHINYMLYASQLAVQGVTMTYGMFFPIRYSFIFTIAGTTLTYTLIFKDIV